MSDDLDSDDDDDDDDDDDMSPVDLGGRGQNMKGRKSRPNGPSVNK